MMLIFIAIHSLGLFYAMGAPQLKLGHSGYELISINDKNPEDSVPLASKLTLESASTYNGIGALNLEKATDPIHGDDGFPLPLQQHKRHYDPQRSSSGPKVIAESQPNMIDVTNKQSSNQKPNIYLTVGIPRSFTDSATAGKEPPNVIPSSEKTNLNPQPKDSFDDSDSLEESRDQEKLMAKSIHAKISNQKSTPAAKLPKQSTGNKSEKIRNQGSYSVSSAMFESDFELADLKDEDEINALVSDVHRALGSIDAKSGFQDKAETVEPPTVKPGFTMVTHFPSIQIHHRKTSFVPHKGPTIVSPIYPSGFDNLAGNPHRKSAIPMKELHGKHLWIDHKNTKSKKKIEMGLEDHKNRLLEFGKLYHDKSSHKIPSVLVLNNLNHDLLNPREGNIMPFPIPVTPLNVPLHFQNQQPLRPMRHRPSHLEIDSIPLVASNFDHSFPTTDFSVLHPQGRWEKNVPSTSFDFSKRNKQANDLDREYLEAKHMITKSELIANSLKNYMGRMSLLNPEPTVRHAEPANELLPPNVESSKGLIIDIVHEVTPDDSQETVIDVKKDDADGEGHEMHDASQIYSSPSPKHSCKQMKPGTPAFYDFLAKFSNILLGKALQYESDIQVQENTSKVIEITENKNLDDNDVFQYIP